ncbi:MAG: hypothetical protein BJ554DRAFT_7331 [Olpidium bornovanus]|uniref:Calcineurin-like phosphoesterase domain-containing protein n=1 Tax=Olpidium bornovanus TaxID=278681 RepID=A0A8H8A221_9FUNG|nr:MAG: hypothetical protein BJ554DRAFT_7331 [Olpidium bornovanus]
MFEESIRSMKSRVVDSVALDAGGTGGSQLGPEREWEEKSAGLRYAASPGSFVGLGVGPRRGGLAGGEGFAAEREARRPRALASHTIPPHLLPSFRPSFPTSTRLPDAGAEGHSAFEYGSAQHRLRLLLLSDVHFCLDKIEALRRRYDFLIVSGDLVNVRQEGGATEKDYAEIRAVLDSLCELTAGGETLFWIPGSVGFKVAAVPFFHGR